MASYERPTVTVLGAVSDLTQDKPGIFFDGSGAQQGNDGPPAPGTPGTS
jgi:hypothetical protein